LKVCDMLKTYIKREITNINKTKVSRVVDDVVVEFPLKILLNGEEFMTTLCTPKSLKPLVIGFLYSEGIIHKLEDVIDVKLSNDMISVSLDETISTGHLFNSKRTQTSGCGKGISFYNAPDKTEAKKIENSGEMKLDTQFIFDTMKEFAKKSELFQRTGGVHSVLLKGKEKEYFEEDIGRHNAVDKVIGHCLIDDVDRSDMVLFTSGRISSEMLLKTANANIPIIASRSAPTSLAVSLANELNITLIGFIRGNRMNIYTDNRKIII